ncbi:MAG: hypothetical protein U9R31_02065 [Candidatus Omnitrophota bacterium]|nr:hypothetical protein [Candidatus Omnitrophota bacterium]
MAKEKFTPEEQLLKLIEKGEAAPTPGLKPKKVSFLKKLWLPFANNLAWSIRKLKKGLKEPNLRVLNSVFLFMCIGLVIYSMADFIFKRPDINEFYQNTRQAIKKMEKTEIKPLVEQHPFLHYFEMVRRRNIFSPVILKKDKPKPKAKGITLSKLAKDLKLVGIAWGKEPVAMIEDTAAKKTYFLKKGNSINQFKIDDVLKGKIILSFKGETLELM